MTFAAMMLVAIGCDLMFGWPNWLYAAIGHPVTWIGALIKALDGALNRDGAADLSRRIAGVITAGIVIGLTAGLAHVAQALLPAGWPSALLGGILAWPLVALRSMHAHVAAVAKPLQNNDLMAARYAVSMIVGRDTTVLDASGVARAAMESLAENTSDGIVAPLFWGAIFGLPGIAAYKAINTLDSMIGHRTRLAQERAARRDAEEDGPAEDQCHHPGDRPVRRVQQQAQGRVCGVADPGLGRLGDVGHGQPSPEVGTPAALMHRSCATTMSSA